jgi:predicted RNA-binding protein with TRAM domain
MCHTPSVTPLFGKLGTTEINDLCSRGDGIRRGDSLLFVGSGFVALPGTSAGHRGLVVAPALGYGELVDADGGLLGALIDALLAS